ncbi:CpsB/CapC family capsule biosynthesis tyrosine phosphatase [Adlercreutzia sp. ZJ138]|uniref:CpsB/CapC family capsule biosynthesis tyrosine phosphatase n=1 Tax=Adlercreutzia sp. ZJ138 TaxID=2709405 RepID=UPI0013EE0DBE|nr:CpsB/CapC family capsule biosynthesis tyrosine phosphatase [Adlercreutzia sp. ZJ138]
MRDIHCHILPGVDDGAANLAESLAMLEAAKRAGVTSIVCTPHCRDPYFNYEAMWDAFELLKAHAGGFPLQMGFEVNHSKLMELGLHWADYLHFDGSKDFLLELSSRAKASDFVEYERTIYELQGRGYRVIIAHPERYAAIQKDVSLARRLAHMGCKLQASADFVRGGRLGREKKPAQALFEQGLYSYIASDAHRTEHYTYLSEARANYRTCGAHARL